MPTYEYTCDKDGPQVINLPFNHEPPLCNICNSVMNRVYSAPAIQFKGTGFYKTGG